MQYLFLRHIALHLLREGYHPTENAVLVFAVRMYAARHIYAFRRAALRFAAAVPAEHPTVALFALVKGDLFFVLFSARVVQFERALSRAPALFPFYFQQFCYNFVFPHMTKYVTIRPFFPRAAHRGGI